MTEALGDDTITLVERIRGKHGQYSDGTRTVLPGCSVQPGGSAEGDQGLTTSSVWTLYCPHIIPENTEQMIEFRDHELQVDGKLQTWYEAGAPMYVTGTLKEWEA